MIGVWWGTRAGLLNGIILTSLSRNFFTDLRKTSVDMSKPRFASSISQSPNDFFSSFFILKKTLGKGPQCDGQSSLSYLVLTCSVDFFKLSPYRPYNKPAFLAIIPPSFTSLNPFVTFSDRCNPILAVTVGKV